MKTRFAFALVLLSAMPSAFGGDSTDPLATAKAFSAALMAKDEATVKTLLAPDVLIYESGGQETSRDEYAGHHMKGDMEFMANAKVQVLDSKHDVGQDRAWVATRSRITAKLKDKSIDVFSTETLVLKRTPEGWRIVHIQWSSRPVEPKKAQ